MTTWTPEHARGAHHAATVDLARRVTSEQAVELALRRVRAAFLADNGWSIAEIATTLGAGERTVRRDVAYMRQLEVGCEPQFTPRIRPADRVHPPVGAA